MKNLFFYFMILLCGKTYSQNPIVPPGKFMADPSAVVGQDGKLYIYGSRDENPSYYCSYFYDVFSTTDLKNWKFTTNIFASKGKNDQVSYKDELLYAPDVKFRNGLYYMYYCMNGTGDIEGVATAKKPEGPFENGKPIKLRGINQIDPCVFIDDDGQAYYVWGQFEAKIAKLKPNMTEIDESSFKDSIITEKDHFFHEGVYMTKRNGIYYLVYAHMGRGGKPTCIGYSISESPMGPYKYGGVIIDNDNCDPGNWNNHGSLVQYKNQWYIFYHRSTQASNTMRKVCAEPVNFNSDGSINEVEMTSQGMSGPLDAFQDLGAERACLLYGNLRINAISSDNEALCKIKNGDQAAFKYLNFGRGAKGIEIRVAPGSKACKIDIGVDNIWGPSIAVIDVPANNGKEWITLTSATQPINGIHAIWLRFTTEGNTDLKVDKLKFFTDEPTNLK